MLIFEDTEYPLTMKVRLYGRYAGKELSVGTIVKIHHIQEQGDLTTIACEVIGGSMDGVSFLTSSDCLK